jgi:hypothetical protein
MLPQQRSDAEPPTGAGLPDYWSTMGGIYIRLEQFGHQIHWGTFNNAIKVITSSIGVFDFEMVESPAEHALHKSRCAWCEEHLGRIYRSGMFMPNLPKHPLCCHYWDIKYVGEKRK